MDRLLEDIWKLELDTLPEDWVDAAFLQEFTAFSEIPEAYQSILDSIEIKSVFQNILTRFGDVEMEEITWSQLSQEIALRNLIALIGYLIKTGVNQVTVSDVRDRALLAARVYFRMLMIPGARAYNVYHSQLFAHTISCLGYPKLMCERSTLFGNIRNLSFEVNNVLRALSEYVHDLRNIILKLKLTPDDINFEDILSNLLDVTGGSITQTLASVDKIVMSNVLGMIYNVISCMLCNYGDHPNPKAIQLLFKCMLPKLIAACIDTKAASNIVRASYVTYTGLIVTSFGRLSIKPYTTMLEHLCYNTDLLERAEPRHARSEMVVGLMSLLSDQRHRTFVQWLMVLSSTAKALHRHMALEVLARLLNNEPEINEQRATLSSEIEKQRAVAATLRNVSSDHSYGLPAAEEVNDENQQPNENEVPEEEEEEVSGILRQQAHTVPIDQILEVVYECAQDVSSQVRSRALAVLCESVGSERTHMRLALQVLQVRSRALAVLCESVGSERTHMRLALQVLQVRSRALAVLCESVGSERTHMRLALQVLQVRSRALAVLCESVGSERTHMRLALQVLQVRSRALAVLCESVGSERTHMRLALQVLQVRSRALAVLCESVGSERTHMRLALQVLQVRSRALAVLCESVGSERTHMRLALQVLQVRSRALAVLCESVGSERTHMRLALQVLQVRSRALAVLCESVGSERTHMRLALQVLQVRSRALAVLCESVGSERTHMRLALQVLQVRSRALAVLCESVGSERTHMRLALQVLQVRSRALAVLCESVGSERTHMRLALQVLQVRSRALAVLCESVGSERTHMRLALQVLQVRSRALAVLCESVGSERTHMRLALQVLQVRSRALAVLCESVGSERTHMRLALQVLQVRSRALAVLCESVGSERTHMRLALQVLQVRSRALAVLCESVGSERTHMRLALQVLQVRSRALAVLCESVGSERTHMRLALQKLNGDGEAPRLMALASRGVCDERAVVRRSGVMLMLRVLRASERELLPVDLLILEKLCRDAAVTVRTAAINAIADLLVQRPGNVTVDAFLTGPMPQLTDPESKVSDVVKAHMDNLVLKRLVKYVPGLCREDQLPWMFLQGVIRMKMKRQLDLACAQLARTDTCISVRLVDILSSHVGVSPERDLQCLVLLNCVARHVAYSDLGFVLDLYYKTTRDPDPESVPPFKINSRMLQQILDLLSAWAQFLKAPDRAALRDNLVTRLATAPDDGCRASAVVLTFALDRNDQVWATELMQLSERRAIEGQSLQEAVRAVDLAMVTPEPPSQELLQMVLNSIDNPPPDCSDAMMGLLVVSLGRMSLRSRPAAAATAPAMARVLHSAAAPLQARVNALLGLADISKRYTSLVEPLLGQMCACLRTSEPVQLRRAAARAITELLLAGFLRLRDTLYYKYVALLADSDADVREPAEYFVTSHLTSDTICHNFVDCIMRYNKTNQEEDIILDYNGRQLVYDVLLQRLTMVQKLNTQCRLARDVLQHAAELADDGEEISAELHDALLDTIRVLVGPRMRLPRKPQQMGETADIEDLQHRVTTNIVSHKMKRTVAEVLVPAVMRLYTRLGAGGGQLATYLVMLAGELEQEYKEEIVELLDNDEELVERIAHFREHFSMERGAGNARNLVTASGPPEPETPRPSRRAARRPPPAKRSLNI